MKEENLTIVETEQQLASLVNVLNKVKCFGVDTEQHMDYSYYGMTCIIQISVQNSSNDPRSHDFLVDGLALRDHIHILNEPFNNTKILKILHGADQDLIWLQRDFGLYVVNVFDTQVGIELYKEHAGENNEGPDKVSLGGLLDYFCNEPKTKELARSDWRQPIKSWSAVMTHYARLDSHYLVYIFRRIARLLDSLEEPNKALTSKGKTLLHVAWENCQDMTLKMWENHNRSIKDALRKHLRDWRKAKGAPLNELQKSVALAVYQWRDAVGRKEDVNPSIVMSKYNAIGIGEKVGKAILQSTDKTAKPSVISECLRKNGRSIPKDHIDDLINIIASEANKV